ncbi:MAG: site-specific integrase [Eubacteriales bacterium]|nr:site-specific integrase [Eubacteriales bacterium]
MPALRLLENENIQHLRGQLQIGDVLQDKLCMCAEDFLIGRNIYDVTLIKESDFRKYKKSLLESGGYTQKQIVERTAALRNIHKYWVELIYGELLSEIDQCTDIERQLVGNVKGFLIRQGIKHISEMNYPLRDCYEKELRKTKTTAATLRYLRTFDKIKQFSVREEIKCFSKKARNQMVYKEQVLFLPYLPNPKLVMDYDKIQDKHELVWDFARKASDQLKRQVFLILNYILEHLYEDDPKERRVRFLLPLRWMYDFCVEENISDIECMEISQIQKFEQSVTMKVANVKNSMQIVDNSRKILFLQGKEIHWHANVWYMERFHFSPDRVNPSNPVMRISFLEVTNRRNRELLQAFARYHLGVGQLTIGNVRLLLYDVKRFLEYFKDDESICQVEAQRLDIYFKELQEAEVKDDTFNKKVNNIFKFYLYLKVNEYISKIPFQPQYYLKKTYPVHYDRCVEEKVYMEILKKLHLFPVIPRLIFLHLWSTGLRVSEVCTLKGDSYDWDGEDAWIKVYQIKMKAEKMIPIPFILYTIMKNYIERNRIKPKDYIFRGSDGGAYRVGSFINVFKDCCIRNCIADREYIFRSHDYRHTLATKFYDDGVSIQTIRDYLGHVTENMTKQYLDYMPQKIAKANDTYFEKTENNLASTFTIKKRGDKK